MTTRSIVELAAALRREGLLVGPRPTDLPVAGVTADSRATTAGMVYVAVRGSQSDGHRFVADAARRGAVAAVVEQPAGVGDS